MSIECQLPSNQICPHTGTLATLQANISGMLVCMQELREDMRDIKKSIQTISILEQKHMSHTEAIERAFKKIEEVARMLDEHEKALRQFEGMKKLAIVLWTVLASGVGVVIMKVFQL